MNDFVSQFLLEARELADQASQDLLALEQDPGSKERLESTFRAFHTLKGAAGIMEYGAMEKLLHRAEDTLQAIRAGTRAVTPEVIDGCLACVGQVIRWLDAIERTGEMPADADAVSARVIAQMAPSQAAIAPASRAAASDLREWAEAQKASAGIALRYAAPKDAFFKGEDPFGVIAALPGLAAMRLAPAQPWGPLADLQPFDSNLVIDALTSAPKGEVEGLLKSLSGAIELLEIGPAPGAANAGDVAAQILDAQKQFALASPGGDAFAGRLGAAGAVAANVLRSTGRDGEVQAIGDAVEQAIASGDPAIFALAIDALSGKASEPDRQQPADGSGPVRREAGAIRVEVEKIDAIVDLTGEMLVVKNALGHWMKLAAEGGDMAELAAGLRVQHARLDRQVAELQRAVLDLRVLPLARVFGRFPLLVRETAGKLGKQIAFQSEGDETEADKAVVEALFEPLLHVVRNSIDHGIEPAAERIKAGKPPIASLVMRGWREGEHVIVEVSDDGRGVDPGAIRRLAVERGLATADAVAALDDDEAVGLIFASGFSTAASVTDLSGRGVGMNAVRTAIDRLGGDVAISNAPGRGLTVRFTLPFTVMMTRVMTLEAGGQTFGIPFDAVLETIRIPRTQIRPLGGGNVFVLRDQTIPVLDLAESLSLGAAASPKPALACIVVAHAAGQRVGLEIDRPGDRLDMMLKPVEGLLAGMPAISGASLLGDGRVLIVLDLGALFG